MALTCGVGTAGVVNESGYNVGAAAIGPVQSFDFAITAPTFLISGSPVAVAFDATDGGASSFTLAVVSDPSGFGCLTIITAPRAGSVFDDGGCGGGVINSGQGGMVWFFQPEGESLPSAPGIDASGALRSLAGGRGAILRFSPDDFDVPEPALMLVLGLILTLGAAAISRGPGFGGGPRAAGNRCH
jgi:hypothetical protein